MTAALTLMAVHAHPDDESSSTGGVLARYSTEGIRTVVVTFTDGNLGDAPGGIKPGTEGYDEELVVRTRRRELEAACEILGVSDLEMMGYRDSGMAGWDANSRPDSFANVPVGEAADRLGQLLDRYQPDVVITYDDAGIYDHPDHRHVTRVTEMAFDRSPFPKKLYFSALVPSRLRQVMKDLEAEGIELPAFPDFDADALRRSTETEARITTNVDVAAFLNQQRTALATHASQLDDTFFIRMPERAFAALFATESFIRVVDTTGAALPEDDLFAGLRSLSKG
jgi:LmbE family N-acetylglucosaminyl deacetylase